MSLFCNTLQINNKIHFSFSNMSTARLEILCDKIVLYIFSSPSVRFSSKLGGHLTSNDLTDIYMDHSNQKKCLLTFCRDIFSNSKKSNF